MQYKVGKPRCTNDLNEPYTPNQCKSHHRPSSSIVHIELVTSWPVTILWILLSWLVSTLATTAYVHPEWFVREHHRREEVLSYDRDGLMSTLGMVSVCYKGRQHNIEKIIGPGHPILVHQDLDKILGPDNQDSDNAQSTGHHDVYKTPVSGHQDIDRGLECHNFEEDFPSGSWQTAYVLFGSGCVLLTWCSILAFCSVWIVGKKNRQLVATLIGRIQLVAAILQAASLLLYPIVLGSSFAKLHCGADTAAYSPAGCRVVLVYGLRYEKLLCIRGSYFTQTRTSFFHEASFKNQLKYQRVFLPFLNKTNIKRYLTECLLHFTLHVCF
ncbi:hypothetical protein JTE90_008698 [Oedothorax gibbosus]|uniref:Uncharacterized protein n=1 Tax=Oedothorax gibbosus TaxID=931172 RepID=A0AAV6V0E1_9ARAC|nr:hypothetical protein JTE90_008698 [Oedothorax gibbosus]